MRHRWLTHHDGSHQFCSLCGVCRRQVYRHCPGVNPARHAYNVWEYSTDNRHTWFWVRRRQPVPVCKGGIS